MSEMKQPSRGDRVRVSIVGMYVNSDGDGLRVRIDDSMDVWLPVDSTVEVLDPEEPGAGAVVVGYASENLVEDPSVYLRVFGLHDDDKFRWQKTGEDSWYSWSQVVEETGHGRKIVEP